MANAQIDRQHAFSGAIFSIAGVEDLKTLDNLRTDLIADYQPVNSQELFAVERIALAQLSLLRVARLEAGIFSAALGEPSTDPLAQGFQRLAGKAAVMPIFLRYQAQSERNYRRAVEEFKRLQKLRKELPNQLTGSHPDPIPPQPPKPRLVKPPSPAPPCPPPAAEPLSTPIVPTAPAAVQSAPAAVNPEARIA